jgi:hypothetical protein
MSNIVARAGAVNIRVGGNTQESAVMVNNLANGTVISKDTSQPGTPPIEYTDDLMYMLGNVSQLVNAWWYLGAPLAAVPPSLTHLTYHLLQAFPSTTRRPLT